MADDPKQSFPNIGGNGFIWILHFHDCTPEMLELGGGSLTGFDPNLYVSLPRPPSGALTDGRWLLRCG